MKGYTIYYPSGMLMHFSDITFTVVNCGEESGMIPCVDNGKSVHMLDPRCMVQGAEGFVYDPRNYKGQLSQTMNEWMSEHPEWPPEDLGKEEL